MQQRAATFVEQVRQQYGGGGGLADEMLMEPRRFHLTMCMLKLLSGSEVQRARRCLRAAAPKFQALLAAGGGARLRLRGLEYMNDDPSDVDVLYSKVGDGPAHEALQALWRDVRNALESDGLLAADEAQTDLSGALKAHATLINSRWRRAAAGGARQSFDASGLLRSHAEFDFGEASLSQLHLSRLAGPLDRETGYYHCEEEVRLVA
eukprot:2731909-Prymnesium_polylepis.1